MQPLTCPIPANINPIQSSGFRFTINKIPEISFFCQEANLPSLDLPDATVGTPFVDYPVPGEKLNFGDFTITFIIDELMNNYMVIHNWLVGLGFPSSTEQYKSFLLGDSLNVSTLQKGYSDGVLEILNSSNNPVRTVVFRDMFPTSLQSLQLQSTSSDTVYLAGTATFKYSLYEIT